MAFLIFMGIMWVGLKVVRLLGRPVPPPLPPGELRRINIRYRCSICGAELKMVLANDELPPAPRHCQEDMEIIAPPLE